jgi:rubrerythrin
MAALKGSRTEQCLKDAFAGESQANRRYLYFANKADVEGQNDVAALFRSTAEGETGHAHGHLEFLEQSGDPATGMPIGSTRQNLASAVAGETHEYTDMYPGMAKTARDEGFDEVADWFETLAKAERSHANRYQKALNRIGRLISAETMLLRLFWGAAISQTVGFNCLRNRINIRRTTWPQKAIWKPPHDIP